MKTQIEIVYAEDHSLEQEGVVRLLTDYPELHIRKCVSNGVELLDWLERNYNNLPDIVLLDINMPFMNGAQAFKKIRRKFPKQKVIILSGHYEDKYISEFFARGAKGFLSKNSRIGTIAETIRRVHEHGICIDPMLSNILIRTKIIRNHRVLDTVAENLGMNATQIKVLKCMLRGMETDAIAEEIGLAYRTAENARGDVWKLAGCQPKNYPALMEFAFKNGLITF